jgi:hemerythrin superfamily protein
MARDAISLITEDHRKVESLFEQLKSRPKDRETLLAELAGILVAHSHAEEEAVYPEITASGARARSDVQHAEDEHHKVEDLLHSVQAIDADDKRFDQRLGQLVERSTNMFRRRRTKSCLR